MKTLTETIQDIANTTTTIRDRVIVCAQAVIRARFVQAQIDDLRGRLDYAIPGAPYRDADQTYDDVPNAALLASYDAEMTRLCQIPGVLAAVLAEMVIEETAP